jgi:hypothetical protein
VAFPVQPVGEPEPIEFETEGENPWITIKLKDGAILKLKVEVTGVIKVGHDPNTGIPIYAVQTQNVLRIDKIPKELIRKQSRGHSTV